MKLPRMIPPKIAMELALTGDFIDTSRAYQLGLVNRITDGSALDAAIELAGAITANGPTAVRVSKQIVVESAGWSQDEMWEKQGALLPQVFMSADAREGAVAFAEKRKPNWTGK
jgi:enoyl-CoA hydratase